METTVNPHRIRVKKNEINDRFPNSSTSFRLTAETGKIPIKFLDTFYIREGKINRLKHYYDPVQNLFPDSASFVL